MTETLVPDEMTFEPRMTFVPDVPTVSPLMITVPPDVVTVAQTAVLLAVAAAAVMALKVNRVCPLSTEPAVDTTPAVAESGKSAMMVPEQAVEPPPVG